MSKITNKFNAEIIIKISEFLLFSYIKITQQPLLKKIDPTINEKNLAVFTHNKCLKSIL